MNLVNKFEIIKTDQFLIIREDNVYYFIKNRRLRKVDITNIFFLIVYTINNSSHEMNKILEKARLILPESSETFRSSSCFSLASKNLIVFIGEIL